ncbi:MAG: hypothetical protein IJ651_07470 [Bacteroidales bacterium]|nr:hypothetical protein [Bacteroidales bacterium]
MQASRFFLSLFAAGVFVAGCASRPSLEQNFREPPVSAKPHTWWHWMNGNVTKAGIKADLEAMAAAGVGGVQCFNVGQMSRGPVDYASDRWYDLTNYAIRTADSLGMEFTMHNCPGWSSSGGFWITPEQAGKQLSWSQAYVKGGTRIEMDLPEPLRTLDRYWDEILLAWPSTQDEALVENYLKTARLDGKQVDPALISMNSGQELRVSRELVLEFSEPVTAQTFNGIVLNDLTEADLRLDNSRRMGGGAGAKGPNVTLYASADGKTWKEVKNLSLLRESVSFASFPPVTFRFAKLTFGRDATVRGIQLSGAPMNENFLRKADFEMNAGGRMFFPGMVQPEPVPVDLPEQYRIDPASVIDLSAHMDKDGHLVWDAPEGDWTILRLGYVPVDRYTKAGSDSGAGLEIDKYSREALAFHWDFLMPRLLENLRANAKNVASGILIDSYEVGNSNWTPLMQEEFSGRRGYEMAAYLPALIGKYVGTEETTERFMWDFRRTCADLFADNYMTYMGELCHENGLILYNEPYNTSVFDELQAGGRADIPMGEFWSHAPQASNTIKEAASIAHVYGKRVNGNQVVGAESFTAVHPNAAYQNFPFSLKVQGDWAWTQGLNRFIFHRFIHEPNTHVPLGMSMGSIGFHFDRNNTWFPEARQWLTYAARAQYMLQQGTIVADALYLINEDVPINGRPDWTGVLPAGYWGDVVNADGFLNQLKVNGSKLTGPEGVDYSVLVLQNVRGRVMSIEVLRKLDQYVSAGGSICGFAPVRTPGIVSDEVNKEFSALVEKLWGGVKPGGRKQVGKGFVYASATAAPALESLGIVPDVEYSYAEDAPLGFIHRQAQEAEIYFLANHRRTPENVVVTFRVDGLRPELWNADTGDITPLDLYDVLPDGRVKVDIPFDPTGSWFVVFREKAAGNHRKSISKDGVPALRTAGYTTRKGGSYPELADNFTILAWLRPENNSSVQSVTGRGPVVSWNGFSSSYPTYPGEGEALYGKGHATVGLNVSRTGVAVMERSAGAPACVASYDGRIGSWNHIAVVYRNGIPSLYINGELKYTGKASGFKVHPSWKDVPVHDETHFFDGTVGEYRILAEAISPEEVRAACAKGVPSVPNQVPEVQYAPEGGYLFFEDGTYTLEGSSGSETVKVEGVGIAKDLTGESWKVSFPEGRGAPAQITLDGLMPLQEHPEDGVRYFSGTAVYSVGFDLPAETMEGKRLFLDLGQVYNLARVKLNGKDLGVLWKLPFSLDITGAVRAGANDLTVEVTNLWTNRLIGDEQVPSVYSYGQMGTISQLPEWYVNNQPKPEDGRVSFSVVKLFEADDPLYDSGLAGPVVVRTAVKY